MHFPPSRKYVKCVSRNDGHMNPKRVEPSDCERKIEARRHFFYGAEMWLFLTNGF